MRVSLIDKVEIAIDKIEEIHVRFNYDVRPRTIDNTRLLLAEIGKGQHMCETH